MIKRQKQPNIVWIVAEPVKPLAEVEPIIQEKPILKSGFSGETGLISPVAREVLIKARQEHYVFTVVGDHGLIVSPVYKQGWWYVPEDNPELSENANRRVELVKSVTPIRGFILAHEAPKLLCPPKEWEPPTPGKVEPLRTPWKPLTDPDWVEVGQVVKTATKVIGAVLLGTLYILSQAVAALAAIDPKLIVVLEDGTWIEVMTWYE